MATCSIWKSLQNFFFALAILVTANTGAPSPVKASDGVWESVRDQVFGEQTIHDGSGKFSFFAPENADDAAIVPVSLRIPANVVADARKITLIIDRNPAPVAATIELGPGYFVSFDIGEREIATRIRVDSFSQVRAILELSDGRLYMHSRFVAGAGGCSAPSSKDPDAALANIGDAKVKVKKNAMRGEFWREGIVMIRHPNFTGMQMNARTGNYTPARYVQKIEVRKAGDWILKIDGGISISENPHFRFSYGGSSGADQLALEAVDTNGVRIVGRSDVRQTNLLEK